MIVGGTVFGSTYVLPTVIGIAASHDYRYVLPIVGPLWIGGQLLASASSCSAQESCFITGPILGLLGVGLILDGVLQAAGFATLVTGGGLYGRSFSSPRVAMVPYSTPGGGGLALGGAF